MCEGEQMQHPKGVEQKVLKDQPGVFREGSQDWEYVEIWTWCDGFRSNIWGHWRWARWMFGLQQVPRCVLFGAKPLDNSIPQALPVNPERPRETAELIT